MSPRDIELIKMQVTIVNTMQLHTAGDSLSIGSPTPNNSVYILDESMKVFRILPSLLRFLLTRCIPQPVPIGAAGIMWAGGACVSRGYLNLPEKTQERYKKDPFSNNGCVRQAGFHMLY